jgi:hypothetical protein
MLTERRFSPAARLACGRWRRKKTHCPQGHAYTEDNVYQYGTMRHCKTCAKARSSAQWQQQKEARHV